MIKKIAPIALVAVLALFAWQYFMKSDGTDVMQAVDSATDSMKDTAETVKDAASDTVDAVKETASDTVNAVKDGASDAVSATSESLNSALDFDNMGDSVAGLFANTSKRLSGITDVETAKAAIPDLTVVASKIDELSVAAKDFSPEKASTLKTLVAEYLPTVTELMKKLTDMPGVGDVVEPILAPVIEKLGALAA